MTSIQVRRRQLVAMMVAVACGAALIAQSPTDPRESRQRAAAIAAVASTLRKELKLSGAGDWDQWSKQLEPVRAALRPFGPRGASLKGRNGYELSRHALDYLLDTDLESGVNSTRPLDVIMAFDRRMKSLGIDFIYVPIPTIEEIYPENFLSTVPKDLTMQPGMRRFLLKLLEHDVEVIDLLRPFLAERTGYRLGLKKDDHWNNVQIELAAKVVAERLRRYGFARAAARDIPRYRTKAVTIDGERGIGAMNQVLTPAGTLYDDVERSPVLVVGDSNLQVYQYANEALKNAGEHAGFNAHLARDLGMPLSLSAVGGFRPDQLNRERRLFEGRKVVLFVGSVSLISTEAWRPIAGQ